MEKRTGISEIRIIGVPGLPEIRPADPIPALLHARLKALRFDLEPGDICLVTQKIISKAEGAVVDLEAVTPSPFALQVARRIKKDPRLLEVVLQQSQRIVRMDRDIMICETKHGWICANAGVDQSNVPGRNFVTLLPADPDGSARRFSRELEALFHFRVPVILTDTFGRPWREGLTNVAIGSAGLEPLIDWRGKKRSFRLRTAEDPCRRCRRTGLGGRIGHGENRRHPHRHRPRICLPAKRRGKSKPDPPPRQRHVPVNAMARLVSNPKNITFSPSFTLPVTRRCSNTCLYCGFREAEGGVMDPAEVEAWLERAREKDCSEVLIISGERVDEIPAIRKSLAERKFADFGRYVAAVCRLALQKGLLPHTNIGILAPPSLALLREVNASMGLMVENVDPVFGRSVHPHKIIEQRLATIENAGSSAFPLPRGSS